MTILWIALLFASSVLAIPPRRNVYTAYVPGFDRTHVERRPSLAERLQHADEEHVSHKIPLRDAVEFVPARSEELRINEGGKVPLRDAVEHREAPFVSGPDHESIWIEQLVPPTIRGGSYSTTPNIVCHLNSKSMNRAEPYTLSSRILPIHRCTHLVYDATTLNVEELTMVSSDHEYDEIKGGYKQLIAARAANPALRVMVSLSSDSENDHFAGMSKQECLSRCRILAKSIVEFLERFDLDGIELNWQNLHGELDNFKTVLRLTREPLKERGLTLAVAVSPNDPIDPEILSLADFVTLKAWRSTNDENGKAQHPAPLKYVARFANKWINAAGPGNTNRLILGVPFTGLGYTLKYENFTSVGSAVVGPSLQSGHVTGKSGQLAYIEVCQKLEENSWTFGRDQEGSFLKLGDQWIGYEDPVSIKIKSAYVRSFGLGGISLRSIDYDDFLGLCGDPWPMLNSAIKVLGFQGNEYVKQCSSNGLRSDPNNCSGFFSCVKGVLYRGHCGHDRFFDHTEGRCKKAVPSMCKPGQSDRIVLQQGTVDAGLRDRQDKEDLQISSQNESRVACYITSWSLYRENDGKFVPERLDSRLCTDVIYAFAGLHPDTLQIQSFDPWADIENNLYQRVTSVYGSRIYLAIGGWTDSSGDKYSKLVNNAGARRKFVLSAVNFLKKHNFDGLSIEWNYPKCWQSNCNKGPDSDKPNFTKLIQELRKEFDKQEPKLLLAVALSGYKEVIDKAYEVELIDQSVDLISVMTYDYHGAWESKTGHLAPLYGSPEDNNPYYNTNFTMEYLVSLGATRSKLLVGVPFYGQTYRLSDMSRTKIGDPTTGPGEAGEFTKQPGMLAYYEICERIRKQGWKTGHGPNAYHKHQWVSYEDTRSAYKKGEFVKQNGYGGVTIWTVDLDDYLNRCCMEPFTLLRSINRGLGRLSTPEPITENCQRPEDPVTPQAPVLTSHSDAADNGHHHPTKPITQSTTKGTTWPSWTERPTTSTTSTTSRTTWPTWSWTPNPITSTTVSVESSKPTTQNPWITQTTSTPSKRPTRPTTTTTETSTVGRACDLGHYTNDPENCSNYYRCVLGELKREQCAPGLHWDINRGLCNWPALAKCEVSSAALPTTTKTPYITTTTTPTTIRVTHPTTVFTRPTRRTTTHAPTIQTTLITPVTKPTYKPEKQCEHGQYYAYPESCTGFLVCVNGNLISQQCGPGLNWNEEKNMCDWAFKSPCNDKPKEYASLTQKDTQTCVAGSYTDVPGDCESYQACLWGKPETFRCAPGLHFNKQTRICDWPSRAKCTDESNSNNGSPSTTKAPSKPDIPTFKPTGRPPFSTTKQPEWTQSTTAATTPIPSAAVDPSKVSPLSGYFKVVCYFTNWSWYRRGSGRYLPEYIDHTLCTHIVYGFAVLDYSELTIKAHDSWADFDNKFYERVVAYKKRGLKVSIALGGWNDSAGDKYSRLVNNPSSRRKFITHVIQFIEKYGFDGLDLDWEYPVCWQVDCKKGPDSDKEGFSALIRELSAELRPKGLLLSSAVSPSKKVIDAGYDVPVLNEYLDWIAVMTYDFHGQWDKKTGHVAPLYYHDDDEFYYFNANYSINYWISKGASPRNIVMGMPLYGQSFSMNDPQAGTGLNVPASAGNAGEFTRAAGFLAYYEICDRVLNRGWTVVQDPERRMGPYAYKGNQWVSFDDSDMIRQKAQFVRDMHLGGGMIWALDLDDFRGRCGEGPHPLMHTLQLVLSEPPTQHDRPIAPPQFGQELEWKLPAFPPNKVSDTTHAETSSELSKPIQPVECEQCGDEGEYKMICYFTNWAWYRQSGGKFVPEDIDPDLCTHILYGFAVLDTTSLTIKSHDPWADTDNKFYERVVAFKEKGIKVLVAIGGWNDSEGDKYSRLVNNPASRRRFITHVLQFIEKYGFDGLDLDWEYPVCWQVDCKKGPSTDKDNFSMFVKELSDEFKPRGLLLSAAVSPSKKVIDAGYDVPTLAKYLDWISIMAYDYHGQWDKKTGHVAPLYALPNDWEPTFNANFSVRYWMEKGAPAKKLVMGVPLYGQSFSLAERNNPTLNSPTYGGGEAGEATRARGFLAYYEICERTLRNSWTVVQDSERRIGPYAYRGDQWVSFDDAIQIRKKAEFIRELGLGGGMIWALDLDDFKNRCGCEPSPLLRTLNRVLRNYPDGPSCDISSSTIIETITETQGSVTMSTSTTTTESNYIPEIDNGGDTIEVEAGTGGQMPPQTIGECNGGLFVPHEQDCRKYYLCNFGNLAEHQCPGGLYWNENRCDWPENTSCKKNKRRNDF